MTRAAARRFQHGAAHRHGTRSLHRDPGPGPSVERAFRPSVRQGPITRAPRRNTRNEASCRDGVAERCAAWIVPDKVEFDPRRVPVAP
ncbi:MAG: hypothetical protein MZU79_01775 [Anaerotruncus sp.]|nr:hypothetical protein [Anaerotruncus sp.]